MRIAVVGARGFIGHHLTRALAGDGHDVLPLSSGAGKAFESTTGVFRGPTGAGTIDAVAYLAQSPHYRDLPRSAGHVWAVNVHSAVLAAEWGQVHGARTLVYASSGSVYAPSFSPHKETDPLRRDDFYSLSKVQGEEATALFAHLGLGVRRARLFGVYGPGQRNMLVPRLAESIRARRPIRLEPHPQNPDDRDGFRLSVCYVGDAVAALKAMLTQLTPDVVNIAASRVANIRELALNVARHVGVEPRFEMTPASRSFDLIADTTEIRNMLGRDMVGLDAGLAMTFTDREPA